MQVLVKEDNNKSTLKIEVNNRKCRICNKRFKHDGNDNYGMNPDNYSCRDCHFWIEKWQIRDEPTTVRINGNHYIIGSDTSSHKGMGGAKVRIVFKDGREVYSTDLWHQGNIPAVWQGFGMEDNAVFGELV